jgi:hypothetical protein
LLFWSCLLELALRAFPPAPEPSVVPGVASEAVPFGSTEPPPEPPDPAEGALGAGWLPPPVPPPPDPPPPDPPPPDPPPPPPSFGAAPGFSRYWSTPESCATTLGAAAAETTATRATSKSVKEAFRIM